PSVNNNFGLGIGMAPTAAGVTTAAAGVSTALAPPTNPNETRGNVYNYNPVANPLGSTDLGAPGLANLPDPVQLAKQAFSTFADQTQPAYEAALRAATERATVGGRLGSGMLTTDYGNLELQRERDLRNQESALINQATEGTIGDRFNQAGLGLQG